MVFGGSGLKNGEIKGKSNGPKAGVPSGIPAVGFPFFSTGLLAARHLTAVEESSVVPARA
jgi:hypothetical protein